MILDASVQLVTTECGYVIIVFVGCPGLNVKSGNSTNSILLDEV